MECKQGNTIRHCNARSLMSLGLLGAAVIFPAHAEQGNTTITFIHTGDIHGDMEPHTNARGDATGELEGGVARVATKVKTLRQRRDNTIHIHTGDTISGSAIATFTKGDALVQVMDQLGIDIATPGNWEFSYGIYRYLQFFGADTDIEEYTDNSGQAIPIPVDEQGIIPSYGAPFAPDQNGETRRWTMIAANAYFNGLAIDTGVLDKGVGELLTRPYTVREIDGVKIGFIGCTTNRGPQVVSSNITQGISFTNCKGEVKFPQNKAIAWDDDNHPNKGIEENPDIPAAEGGDGGYRTVPEIARWVDHLRNVEEVDIVAVLSEGGLAENIYNAENISGVDIYFSSDMHEETKVPVVVTAPDGRKVLVIENGEDGAQVGELRVTHHPIHGLRQWRYTAHDIGPSVKEDQAIAELVEEIHAPFESEHFEPGVWVNPFNNAALMAPLDAVMGNTDLIIERNRFSNEWDPDNKIMPGIIEGTGHQLITDAFRVLTNAQVGGIRGFRYTNTVLAGDDITWDDIYHYMPIGAMIAKADIPVAPESELAESDLDNIEDIDGDGRTLEDNKENPRHYLAWPRNLVQEIELSGNSTMNPIVTSWGGGWVFNYSGIQFNFHPDGPNFNRYGKVDRARLSNLVFTDGTPVPTGLGTTVSYASYYYDVDANRVNRNQIVTTTDRDTIGDLIQVLAKDGMGLDANYVMVNPKEYEAGTQADPQAIFPLDAVEAMARYIGDHEIPVYDWDAGNLVKADMLYTAQGLGGSVVKADFVYPRIHLIDDNGVSANTLVDATMEFGFPVIEPLRGAEGALLNGNVTLPDDYIKGIADTPSDKGRF